MTGPREPRQRSPFFDDEVGTELCDALRFGNLERAFERHDRQTRTERLKARIDAEDAAGCDAARVDERAVPVVGDNTGGHADRERVARQEPAFALVHAAL